MDLISLIMSIPGVGPYIPYITLAVTIASAIATALPAPAADSGNAYKALYGALNWIALNKGHATNAGVSK